jgi:transcriptional regulator with XRE-family HTH domain
MGKSKEPKEIGKFIKESIAERKLTQTGLAEKIVILKDETDIGLWKNAIKSSISKWISPGNESSNPSTDYLYYLAQSLGFSIEQISINEENNGKLDNRATLYSSAKCSTAEQLEKLIHDKEEDIYGLWEEYNKESIDYMLLINPLSYIKLISHQSNECERN